MSLERFHDVFGRYLMGELASEEVERRLGPSVSGRRRLDTYRALLCRSLNQVLSRLLPATRTAVEQWAGRSWQGLVLQYHRHSPPTHTDPNYWGAGFSDFLSTLRVSDDTLPEHALELSDYEWTCYATGVDQFQSSAEDIGLERTLHVRHYEFDVPKLARAFGCGEKPMVTRSPTTVVIYRDPRTERARAYYPSPLGLLAIARAAGHRAAAGVTDPSLGRATRELVTAGVLPPIPDVELARLPGSS